MQLNQYTAAPAQPRPHLDYPTWTTPRAPSEDRSVDSEGLSRDELRRLVIDMIG